MVRPGWLVASGLSVLVLAISAAPGPGDDPPQKGKSARTGKATPEPKSADAIVDQVAKTYAEAKTYEDTGEMVEVNNPGEMAITSQSRFATKWGGPDRWIFDGRHQAIPELPPTTFLAWSTGSAKESFSQIDDQASVRSSSTLFRFGLINGVFTAPISQLAPDLLGPADQFTKPEILKPDRKWKLTGSEKVGPADCHVLTGVSGSNADADARLWVDKKTSLIRRYREVGSRTPNKYEKTITLQPKIDEPIDPKSFDPKSAEGPKPAAKASPTKKAKGARKKGAAQP